MKRTLIVCVSWLAAAAAGAAWAADAVPAAPASIAHCVAGPGLAFGPGDSRAVLKPADRQRVQAALSERYPMLERDGFAPLHILLWRKANGQWLYVSLSGNGQPSELCFTATFSGEGIEFTRELVQQYFFAGAAPA